MTDALKKMREDFPPNQISKMCRSTKKDNPKGSCPKCKGYHGLPAIQLDYVGHAALTDRLLDADPSWTWEPLALDQRGYPAIDNDGGMWIKLTVGGVTRLGYGDAQGKTGGDAMKERIGDALRNAAMRFGAALDLWHKGDLHVEEDAPTPIKAAPKAKELTPDELDDVFTAIDYCATVEKLTEICAEAKKKANALQLSQIVGLFNSKSKQILAAPLQDAFPGATVEP